MATNKKESCLSLPVNNPTDTGRMLNPALKNHDQRLPCTNPLPKEVKDGKGVQAPIIWVAVLPSFMLKHTRSGDTRISFGDKMGMNLAK
ncbi:hypothetical protein NDU88_002775 [Pleurodeles waltl]|uniref:Uncharacterized protein n=1 Tax=Pleurodeles waltl TaxID=8319 RepID=A0AAV7WQG9_PLEWA|nr:hypothetical protein NDU88_002775 [Pleurodeles waltl]